MINEIKKALSDATPGPWSMNDMDMAYSNEVFINPTGWEYIQIAGGMKIEDAHLISQAPIYIRYLLDELEKAQKEKSLLHESFMQQVNLADELIVKNAAIRREKTSMKKALEWYADKVNYLSGDYQIGNAPIWDDVGDTARTILSTLKREQTHE